MTTLQQAVKLAFSPYQENLFHFVAEGEGSAIVVAVAGSGKTTSGVEAVRRIPYGKSHVYLAFNKSIATELSGRGVNGRTFHSMTYSPVLRARKAQQVESNKLRKLIDGHFGDEDVAMYGAFVARLVGLGRNAGIGCLAQDLPEAWAALIEHHDLELDSDRANIETAIEYAQKLLQLSNASDMVDFDDMLYFAVRDGISLPKFDFVFVDEAQDTNAIQRAIIRKIMKPTSRLIAVGDPAQAIYGFRGADSNSISMIKEEFNCVELPLTVSYRCPTSVVDFARQWVSHIEAAPSAPEGSVKRLGAWGPETFVANDLVVCRTTAPLISIAYQMLRAKRPVRVMGRDIGDGLKSLIKRLNARGVDALLEKLAEWADRESEKALAKQQDAKAEAIRDKAAAIACLIDALPETERTVPELLRVIDSLFDEKIGATVLATVHKSKGLEAARVYWLNSSKCPAPWARKPWQQEQERNLCYVAATRAKSELILIEDEQIASRRREAA
jgi:superfamily I DNA/RNA helicase